MVILLIHSITKRIIPMKQVQEQNLTGKDSFYTRNIIKETIDNPEDPLKPSYSFTTVYTKHLKPYIFYTANGAIFSIEYIYNEVCECLISNSFREPRVGRSKSSRYQCSHHHTHSNPKFYNMRENRTKTTCEEQGVKYRTKALLGKGLNYSSFESKRRSNGWKDHKYKKQWEHNLVNKKIRHQFSSKYYSRENDVLKEELEISKDLHLYEEYDSYLESM